MPANPTFVRALLPAELPEVLRIDGIVFGEEDSIPEELWKAPNIETYWVLVNGEKAGLVAVALDETVPATIDAEAVPEEGTVYVFTVDILPDFQGRGLGTAAIRWMGEEAPYIEGRTSIVSTIRSSREAYIEAHVRAGWKRNGTIPGFFSGPSEDAVIIRKIF